MIPPARTPHMSDLLIRFAVDLAGMILLIFGMYYRRNRDKKLVTTAALFNVFVFGVLIVLSLAEFSITTGFGLFAILALFTLRSEQITKIEISYFFGSISIAVITAVVGTTVPTVLLIVVLALLGAYIFDHPRVLRSVSDMKVTLEGTNLQAWGAQDAMRAELSQRLGIDVLSYRITSIDVPKNQLKLDVFYRNAR